MNVLHSVNVVWSTCSNKHNTEASVQLLTSWIICAMTLLKNKSRVHALHILSVQETESVADRQATISSSNLGVGKPVYAPQIKTRTAHQPLVHIAMPFNLNTNIILYDILYVV